MLRVGHAHHRQPCSLLLCKTVLYRGHQTGRSTTNRFDQADIRDRHLFDFQLVASDYTDCPLRYTRLSSILNQKAGHSTCHFQVHKKLIPCWPSSPSSNPSPSIGSRQDRLRSMAPYHRGLPRRRLHADFDSDLNHTPGNVNANDPGDHQSLPQVFAAISRSMFRLY